MYPTVKKDKVKIIVFLGIFLCCFVNCTDKGHQEESYRYVRLISPETSAQTNSEGYSGIIEEGKNVNASFMADGKIRSLLVKEGDRVRKGQLIAALDDDDYQIGVNQLRAQFRQMTEEKKRMDEMFARHNIAPNDYEKFSAGYEQLELQMQMAENKLGYTKLYSPSDGYVSEKYMEPGELVGAGTPVYKITDDSNLIANVDLPVNVFLNRDKIVSVSGFSPAFPDESIPLSVESFTPDPSNNMLYKMKLLVPSRYARELTSGMNMRVEITSGAGDSEGMRVGSRSVFEENGKNYVWVYNPNDSTITKKVVNIVGTPVDNKLNVTGLTGKELIVETGVKQLYEGEKVNISKNSDFGL